MNKHYLSPLFSPRSVAVIGASDRVDSVGWVVFKNMLEGGYQGKLYPVNPNHAEIQGQRAYADIKQIGEPIDLAVIVTKAAAVPDIIELCGKQGTRVALVLSAGFSEIGSQGAALERAVVENAKRYGMPGYSVPCSGFECHFQQRGCNCRKPGLDFSIWGFLHGDSGLGATE